MHMEVEVELRAHSGLVQKENSVREARKENSVREDRKENSAREDRNQS